MPFGIKVNIFIKIGQNRNAYAKIWNSRNEIKVFRGEMQISRVLIFMILNGKSRTGSKITGLIFFMTNPVKIYSSVLGNQALKWSQKIFLQAGQWRNIARNHGNIDIILIHERPSVSLLPSNNPQGKRAQELARAIWAILQFSNSLPSSQNYRAV